MSDYKISIIMPVYNAEDEIENSIISILNQDMSLEDIEVIFVDDYSSDSSRDIIESYCEEYSNFKLVCLEENVGAAYGPRNVGLDYVSGDFVMFLDSDDCFHHNACRVLYESISCDDEVDLAFTRYCRFYPDKNLKLKGYSPYKDNINEYEDDLTSGAQFSGLTKFLWKGIFSKIFYGSKKDSKDFTITIRDIKDHSEVFKILPSIWTRIYRTSFIKKYNLRFPKFISGEDLNFVIESYFLARKIVFLNEHIVHDYYMRDMSITKNITYPMVYDSLDSYYNACKICGKYDFEDTSLFLNPFLLNWISLYKKANLSKDEKNELYNLVCDFKVSGFISRFLVFFIKFLLKI